MRSLSRVHDSLVVESIENVVQNTDRAPETLVGSVTDYAWCADWGEEPFEWFCVLDACGVVEGENSNDVSWIKTNTRLFDELNNAILRSGQLHIHLHDLLCALSGSRRREGKK